MAMDPEIKMKRTLRKIHDRLKNEPLNSHELGDVDADLMGLEEYDRVTFQGKFKYDLRFLRTFTAKLLEMKNGR